MTGSARAVTCCEKRLHGGHVVVAPEVLGRGDILGTADPCAGCAGMGTDEVRFGGGDFGSFFFGLNVHARPEERLADGHIQEVFPCLALKFFHFSLESLGIVFVLGSNVADGLFRSHVDGALPAMTSSIPSQLRRLAGIGLPRP